MSKDDREESHPSYALVQFSRITHGPGREQLFGSSIDQHQTTIKLTVRSAVVRHQHHHDNFFSNQRLPYVEVEMSPAQFSELLTTMNMGDGIPGTLRILQGERIEDPPPREVEARQVQTGFSRKMRDVQTSFDRAVARAKGLLSQPRLKKAERMEILDALNRVSMELGPNAEFALESFEEATEKIVTTAKAEADAFLTSAVNQAGIRALAEKQQPLPQPLPPPLLGDRYIHTMNQEERDRWERSPPLESNPPTGTTCSCCGLPQYRSPSGVVCRKGHGGESALEDMSRKELSKAFARVCGHEGCRTKSNTVNANYCRYHAAVMAALEKCLEEEP